MKLMTDIKNGIRSYQKTSHCFLAILSLSKYSSNNWYDVHLQQTETVLLADEIMFHRNSRLFGPNANVAPNQPIQPIQSGA